MRNNTRVTWLILAFFVAAIGLSGCGTSSPVYQENKELERAASQKPVQPEEIILHEGDVVTVSFPGNTTLKSETRQIRRDGKITLDKAGEVVAAGKTVKVLKEELLKKYNEEMSVQEVTVVIESSVFPVYVTGAVLRPGKVMSDRPLTALDAIMESGGPDYVRANLKAVKVLRNVNGQLEHHKLNLDKVLKGEDSETFYLKPYDIVFIPERFSWL